MQSQGSLEPEEGRAAIDMASPERTRLAHWLSRWRWGSQVEGCTAFLAAGKGRDRGFPRQSPEGSELRHHLDAQRDLYQTSDLQGCKIINVYCFFLRFFKFILRETGREGEKEGKKHQCARETSICCLSHVPWLGTNFATQSCALTRNHTSDPSFALRDDTQQTEPHWSRQACTDYH